MKKIWIINHYAGDMFEAEGGRHYYFAKYLKRMGQEPIVFCANSKHNTDAESFFPMEGLWHETVNDLTDVPYVFIKARPYKGNGKARILNMIDFYFNVVRAASQYKRKNGSPDIIIASSVHPLTLLAGIKLARKCKIKCISEVRDLWPESIVAYLDGFRKNNPLIKALYLGEKNIYRKSDAIIFTMEGGYDYIREKGWDTVIPDSKVFHINNGVDLEQFISNRREFRIADADLEDADIYKVIYAGSIRRVNNLDKLLDAARAVKNEKIRFLIWGDGDERERLEKRVFNEKIANVVFKGKVDKKYIPYITSKADLNIAHNEESPIFRFGISFNKIFDYLAAGRPIICDFSSEYNPALKYGAGVCSETSDPESIAESIDLMASSSEEEVGKYCSSAINASEYYDYRNLTKELLDVIDKTIQQ